MTTTTTSQRLHRSTPAPPVRIVHLGLGAFSRAHQAWYTAHASDAADWGIAAFTGRSTELATRLTEQDGLFTLIRRGPSVDEFEIVHSIVQAEPGANVAEFVRLLAAPSTAILTLTITESGYMQAGAGEIDLDDARVRADIEALARGDSAPTTALGRVLAGLDGRRREDAGPIALVSCDNLPENGDVLGRSLISMAHNFSHDLEAWIGDYVSFVSTSVDRITPRYSATDAADVLAATGIADSVPVVAEPFSDWVLSGTFPAGRPDWESAGATFVDDLAPFEARKLWLLNGAHSLLSFAGPLRGHTTVAEAFADPECRRAVDALWDDDTRNLPDYLDLTLYRRALADRFSNPRIAHHLDQIAIDGLRKLQVRVVPVARLDLAAGDTAAGCAAAMGAWIAASGGTTDCLLPRLDPHLAVDEAFAARVERERRRWSSP